MTEIHDLTKPQLDETPIERGRPLIICDADEVLVHFVGPLAEHFADKGYILELKNFAISGNVRHAETGAEPHPREIGEMIDSFFAQSMHRQRAIDGAAENLHALSAQAQVVVLTNVPHAQRGARQQALKDMAMDYPVIANAGAKGGAVRHLAEAADAPTFFLDDLPPNLTSAADAGANAHLIHFVGSPQLQAVVPQCDAAHFYSTDWNAVRAYIEGQLG